MKKMIYGFFCFLLAGILPVSAGLTEALSDWVQEESDAHQQAGHTDLASRMDLAVLPETIWFTPAPEQLCPPIPDFENNPIAEGALERIEKLLKENKRFPKTGSDKRSPAGGGALHDLTQESLLLTQAFCHHQSPYAGSPELVVPMLRRYAAIYDRLSLDPKLLADFGISPSLTDMYLLLKTSCPNLILPTLQAEWEAIIRRNADAIVAKKKTEFETATSADSWVNADVRWIETLYLASVLFNEPSYRQLADKGLNYLAMSLLPDGAFHYVHLQNEVFTYHEANIAALARINQVAGVPLARRLIEDSREYYPLSIEPRGVAEYSTASFWKPYWNMSTGGGGATIVADACDCPCNARIARMQPLRNPTLWMASFYRFDLEPVPAEDDYILYDRNIRGARGRFGDYSFVATARDYEGGNRGKGTFVGCTLLYPKGTLPEGVRESWPLNAAVHEVGSQVRFAHGRDDFRRMNHHSLAQNEENACAVTEEVVALSSVYSLSHYKSKPVPWQGQQQWILTPHRMVGLVRLTALEEQQAYSIGGTVKTVSGRQFWGIAHPWETPEKNLHKYGGINIRIHDTDYPFVKTANIDTYSGNTKKSGRLELLDNESEQEKITYEKGHSRFFLTEISPEGSAPAKAVTHRTLDNGLVELTLIEANGTKYRIVHNPQNISKGWKTEEDGSFIRNGAQYRPDWLGDSRPGKWEPLHAGQELSIPAHEFVLVKAAGEAVPTISQEERDYARNNLAAEKTTTPSLGKIAAQELSARGGLSRFFEKAKAGEKLTVAYFGGSITAAPGWRPMTFDGLQKMFPKSELTMVNASVGGTGSIVGVFRADQDLLPCNPDLVFIEFAVNDGSDAARRKKDVLRALEGIVLKVKQQNPAADICLVYTMQAQYEKTVRDGWAHEAAALHEQVAQHYNLPSIYVGPAVVQAIDVGDAVFTGKVADKATGRDAEGRLVITQDKTHPVTPTGYAFYANVVMRSLEKMAALPAKPQGELPFPMFGKSWVQATTIPVEGNAEFSKHWKKFTSADGPSCWRFGKKIYSQFPHLYRTDEAGASVTVRFKGSVVGIKGFNGPDSGIVTVKIDDQPATEKNYFTVYNKSDFYAGDVLPELEDGEHTITWTLSDSKPDKGKILASYYKPDNDRDFRENPDKYEPVRFSVGQIQLIGEIQ